MRKPTTWKQSEKTRHHRNEAKRERRKARKRQLTPEQVERREWEQAAKIVHGEILLLKFGEHLIEESRQREIEESIVEGE